MNRLDYETSGILIAAKTRACWQALHQQIMEGAIYKSYLALVEGEFPASITLENYLGAPNRRAQRIRVYERQPPGRERALPARTEFFRLRHLPALGASLVKAVAHTARRHQIRAHAGHLGHPLVGDALYGSPRSLRDLLPPSEPTDEIPLFLLHAGEVRFEHPILRTPLTVTAPPPGLLARFL